MPLEKKITTITDRLRTVYPPVERAEGSFSDALRRIADRLDAASSSSDGIAKPGIPPEECLDLIETITLVASMDDVVVSAVTCTKTAAGMEVRFILEGETSVIDGLTAAIDHIQTKTR